MRLRSSFANCLFLLLGLNLLGRFAQAAPPTVAATPSLAQALNPDGTLRPGAAGSFDARQYRMQTAPDGRPVFRPSGTTGAGDFRWADGFGLPNGTNGDVRAVIQVGTDVYIGGAFTVVGGVVANRVARWNGTAWSALGTGAANGMNASVATLAVSGSGELYAGGWFTSAGGVTANRVARWNGTAWSSLGTGPANGTNSLVSALAVSGSGQVYVGGQFTQAGGLMVNSVAQWNGTAWSSLGGPGTANGVGASVLALAVSGSGEVYVAGEFTRAGGTAANRVAKWNGTAWSALGTGVGTVSSNAVFALAVSGSGDVYAVGRFAQAGGIAATNIARWNGTAWSALGTGAGTSSNDAVYAVAVGGNGDVYVGGNFLQAGGMTVANIARWNGTTWSDLATGVGSGINYTMVTVAALAVLGNGDVYAGGNFTQAGSGVANSIARWNGTAWNGLGPGTGNGTNGLVTAVAVSGTGDVYVGGIFTQAGNIAANRVAKWNGSTWSALGTGITDPGRVFNNSAGVGALAVAGNGDVYVGGGFTQAGGVAANNVARWDGTAWSSLGTGTANGVGSSVLALVIAGNGDVYAGGGFNQAGGVVANRIARWNGTVWSSLGTGAANGVRGSGATILALAVANNGDLYVGGYFNQAGTAAANNIAKWNGTTWSALSTGASASGMYNPVVYALAISGNGALYMAGYFTQAGSLAVNSVARWNGTTWSGLGTGTANSINAYVFALAVSASGDLYIGGVFNQTGGGVANCVVRWNGTAWNRLGTGLNDGVRALGLGANNKLYAGGDFSGTGDNSKASVGFAIYDPAAVSATAPAAPRETLSLTPNPAHGPATLTLLPAATARAGQVLDELGRVVRAFVVPARAVGAALEVGGLPAGAYTVRVGPATGRLVVE